MNDIIVIIIFVGAVLVLGLVIWIVEKTPGKIRNTLCPKCHSTEVRLENFSVTDHGPCGASSEYYYICTECKNTWHEYGTG